MKKEKDIREDELKKLEKWLFDNGYLFAETIGSGADVETYFASVPYVINEYRRYKKEREAR